MSILKRSVFYDNTGGIARFWDWAVVTTTLGAMVEPFSPNVRHSPGNSVLDFDPTDEIARIDSIRAAPRDKSKLMLSGGEHVLNGGDIHPRTGP
jgi:hypothetical protein